MQPRLSFLTALLAIVAVFAASISPLGMGRAEARSTPAAMAAMPVMAHHDMGGAPCAARGCCTICQALLARCEALPVVLEVRAVKFPATASTLRASAVLEQSTPPPRSF